MVKKEAKKKGVRWKTSEAFASMGAFIAYAYLDSNKVNHIERVVISIDGVKSGRESYTHEMKYLKRIPNFVTVSKKFFEYWNEKKYDKLYQLLGPEISNTLNNADTFVTTIRPLFLDSKITGSYIVAFKINNDVIGIYFNAYYEGGFSQSYILNYYLDKNDKIIGITTPNE